MARVRTEELHRLAKEQGLDPAKISRRADLGYTTVYALWDGSTKNPGLQTIAAIARVLGVRTADLIEDELDADREQVTGSNKLIPDLARALG